MVAVILILIVVFAISVVSEVHALGLWVFLMITHGFLVELIGAGAGHLPMYAGLIIMVITVGRGKWTGMRANIWLLLSCLVVFIALAALFGMDPASSIERLILYSKGFLLAIFIGGVIKDASQIQIVTLYCVAAAFTGACIAVGQHLTGAYAIDAYEIQRAAGLSGDPNDTAMLLLTGIPLAIYWFTNSNNRYVKLMFASVVVFTIGAITLTQSRGGGVALLLILLLFYLRRPSIKALVVGIVLVSAGLLFTSADYWERMETLGTVADSTDGSLSVRFRFIEIGIDVFLRNPVLGIGMGNFGKALVESDPDFNNTRIVAHNMYLEFFVENGIFAGLLFLALLASALIHSFRYDKYDQIKNSAYGLGFCVSMSLVAIMIAGLFLSQGRNSVLWFLVGIGLAFPKVITSSKATAVQRSREIVIDR